MPERPDLVSAPPDEGHHGSDTRPEETLQVRDSQVPRRAPSTHRDPSRHPRGPVMPLIPVLIILAIVIAFLFLALFP